MGSGYLCSALVFAAAAHAAWPREAAAAELLLDEPAPCTNASELSFHVERLLGQPLAAVEGLQLSVRIEPTAGGYGAQLGVARHGEDAGTRRLDAASCTELSESLVLAIVVAIGAIAEPAEPAHGKNVPQAQARTPADTLMRAAPALLPTEPGPEVSATAWMLGDTGTLPAPGIGVAIGIAAAWPALELRGIGTWLPEREGTLATLDANAPSASIGLLAGTALACVPFAVAARDLRLVACGGWEIGQLSASGTHVSVSYRQRRLWSAARLDLAGRWAVADSSLGVELLATLAAPLTRDDFVVENAGSVHRPANVVGRLGVGLSWSFDRAIDR